MPGPDLSGSLSVLGLFAYGPAPGVELIPYFLALLGWVVLALGAILLSPLTALLRLLRRRRAGGVSPLLRQSPRRVVLRPHAPSL